MAITYGISDRKVGSIGTLTYAITKDGNVVKEKIIKNKSHTEPQVKQRCFFSSVVKAASLISADFLEKCFESTNRKLSYSNHFVKINRRNGTVLAKQYAKDPNVISFGNWRISEGSLVTGLSLTNTTLSGTDTYIGITIGSQTEIPTDGNATVGQVSTALIAAFPELTNNITISMVCIDNIGVTYVDQEPIPIATAEQHYIKLIKQNFIINKTDNALIKDKGFTVVKSNDNVYSLLLLNEGSTTEVCADLKYAADNFDINIAVAGLVVAKTEGTKIFVQTADMIGNWPYEQAKRMLFEDLNTDKENLYTYDIEQDAMIVNNEII